MLWPHRAADVIGGMRINNPGPDSDLCYSGIDPWQLVGLISALPQPRSPCLPRTVNGAGDIWSLSKADPCGEGCSIGEQAEGQGCSPGQSTAPFFLLAPGIERCDKDHPARDVMSCASPRLGENVAQWVRIHEQGYVGWMEEKSLAPGKACGVFPQGSR